MEKPGSLQGTWSKLLAEEFDQPYMQSLKKFISKEKLQGKEIFPPGPEIFSAFNATSFEDVSVVILGQDPYHGPRQAHGLSFSVRPNIKVPPSLRNIYKELESDLGLEVPVSGDLSAWAAQGVLLLNSVLTVESGNAGAHQGKGWELFTDRVIQLLDEKRQDLVFLLWGSYAQKKGQFLNRSKHLVLQAPHPSPLSAHRGFLGCGHFSQANRYLSGKGLTPIDWQIP